jgi:hypothetical protein
MDEFRTIILTDAFLDELVKIAADEKTRGLESPWAHAARLQAEGRDPKKYMAHKRLSEKTKKMKPGLVRSMVESFLKRVAV